MAVNTDPGVQMVLDNMQIIVATEGGSLEFVELSGGRLTVRYTEGQNEECPECVPDHDSVRQMMKTAIGVHAPYVKDIELL